MPSSQCSPSPVVGITRSRAAAGHDLAYVRVDGIDVGYRDLVTGEIVCTLDGHAATIDCTTAELFVAAGRRTRARA